MRRILVKRTLVSVPVLTFLLLMVMVTLASSSAAAIGGPYNFTGVAHHVNGTTMQGANATVTYVNSTGATIVKSNTSNSTGGFTVPDIPSNAMNVRITVQKTNASGTVTYTNKPGPMLTGDMLGTLDTVNYFLRPAVTLNLTAHNATGAAESFMYQVKDTKLGYPVASNFTFQTGANVTLPANRNYAVKVIPQQGMESSKEVTNITSNASWQQDNRRKVRFNMTEDYKWIEGYANTTGTARSPGFTNLSVVPYRMEPGKGGVPMTFKGFSNPMRNFSALRYPQQSDQYNVTTGYYNITLVGQAETANYVLFYSAYNQSEDQYYGGYTNTSLTAGQTDMTGQNVTLKPLVGKPGNITTDTWNASFAQNKVNVSTAKRRFQVQNTSGVPKNGFVRFEVDYSSGFDRLDTPFTRLTQTSQGNFSFPVLNETVDAIDVYPSGSAPKSTSIGTDRLANSPVEINVTKIQPGSPDGSSFGDIEVNLFRSDSDTDVPNPNMSKSLIPEGERGLDKFNVFSAMLGGGDLSFRMKKESNNITVHYVDTDLLASGPPDALFDSNSSTSGGGSSVQEAWRFGSQGPEIYDHVLVGMPYNDSVHADSGTFTMKIGKFYDDDWNVIWNASTNSTSEIPSSYDAYLKPKYKGYVDGSGITASKTDQTSTVYVNTSSDMVWMEIPHFSGVSPTISSSSGGTSSGGDTSGGGVASPPTLKGEFSDTFKKYAMLSLSAGESGDVPMPDGSPVTSLRITAKDSVLDPSFTVGQHAGTPDTVDDPSGAVETYLEISTSLSDDDVDSVDIEFTVERTWLDENDLEPGDVVLSRWHDGAWQDLETRVVSEGADVTLTAASPGFSTFAVHGETADAEPTPTPTERATPTPTATPTDTATGAEEPTDTPASPGLTALPGIAGLLAALYVARTRS